MTFTITNDRQWRQGKYPVSLSMNVGTKVALVTPRRNFIFWSWTTQQSARKGQWLRPENVINTEMSEVQIPAQLLFINHCRVPLVQCRTVSSELPRRGMKQSDAGSDDKDCDLYLQSCRLRISVETPTILTLRLLMSYIYGAPILDVSRSHTTTQHSR